MPTIAKSISRKDGGEFTGRFYEIETGSGEVLRYPSVTTILQAAPNKPGLIRWAASEERTLVKEAAADLYLDAPASPKMSKAAFVASLEKRLGATRAHAKILSKASELGSSVHALIEWNVRKSLGQEQGPAPEITPEGLHAFSAWERWRDEVELVPRLVEQVVWSRRYGYAGTTDLVGEFTHEGKRVQAVIDWKSSKSLHPEMFLQLSAYMAALVEMEHIKPGGYGCIVRLPKKVHDPEFEVGIMQPDEQSDLFGVFLHCQQIWKWLEAQK